MDELQELSFMIGLYVPHLHVECLAPAFQLIAEIWHRSQGGHRVWAAEDRDTPLRVATAQLT
ncbi:hypothetical protein A5717_10425 [Mycolicibacterium porcinum]|nr:hypothetical protein A5717_10425 [Mycolicibacterium porcinum]